MLIRYTTRPEPGTDDSKVPMARRYSTTKYSEADTGELIRQALLVEDVIGFSVYMPEVLITGMLAIQPP